MHLPGTTPAPERWSAMIQRFVHRTPCLLKFPEMVTAPEIVGRSASISELYLLLKIGKSVDHDWKADFACVWLFTQCTGYWPCWRHFLPIRTDVARDESNQLNITPLFLMPFAGIKGWFGMERQRFDLICAEWLKWREPEAQSEESALPQAP